MTEAGDHLGEAASAGQSDQQASMCTFNQQSSIKSDSNNTILLSDQNRKRKHLHSIYVNLHPSETFKAAFMEQTLSS